MGHPSSLFDDLEAKFHYLITGPKPVALHGARARPRRPQAPHPPTGATRPSHRIRELAPARRRHARTDLPRHRPHRRPALDGGHRLDAAARAKPAASWPAASPATPPTSTPRSSPASSTPSAPSAPAAPASPGTSSTRPNSPPAASAAAKAAPSWASPRPPTEKPSTPPGNTPPPPMPNPRALARPRLRPPVRRPSRRPPPRRGRSPHPHPGRRPQPPGDRWRERHSLQHPPSAPPPRPQPAARVLGCRRLLNRAASRIYHRSRRVPEIAAVSGPGRAVDLALPNRMLGDIRHPQFIGAGAGRLAVDQVGRGRGLVDEPAVFVAG
jgi:hypothetical protein